MPVQVARPISHSLGVDVSPVRIHSDARAAAAADAVQARAFAYGTGVYLGSGQRPTDVGLVAHEVAHVVQQQGGPALQMFTSAGADPFEREAQSASAAVVGGRAARVSGRTAGPRIQRDSLWGSIVSGAKAVGGAVVSGVKAVGDLALEALNAAKKAALDYIKEHARSFPGYDLLAFILERDPITQEPMPRTPMSLAKGLLGLVPGGAAMFEDLQQSGALQKTVDWFLGETKKLDLTWAGIRALFATAWDQLSLSDLVPPTKAWEKIKAIFGPTVGRLVEFAKSVGSKILELMFEAVMGRGSLGEQILAFFRKVKAVFGIIVADPKKFLANLLAAFKGGVQKFADNFVEHLKKALFDWLFGALKGALTLPKKFDLMGLVDIVLQVLGLTYSNIRAILVEKIGEPAVGYIEKAFEFLKVLVTQGLAAAWEKLKEFASDMIDTVISGIVSWVSKTIVGAAVIKLVSMFNPVGAFIQSIITIYDTVKFFIEKAKQIAAFINSVVDSIERIATGNIAGAIDYVESTLEKALGVVIAFLANFLHLGGIADKIKEVIKKIQDKVLGAIRKLVDWVANQVKGLLAGLGGKGGADEPMPEEGFDAGGEHHRVFLQKEGDREIVMIASEKQRIEKFFSDFEGDPKLGPVVAAGKAAAKKVDDKANEVEKLKPKTTDPKKVPVENPKLPGLRKELGDAEKELAGHVQKLLDATDISKLDLGYATEGMVATYGSMPKETGDNLTPDHQPQHALMTDVSKFKVLGGLAVSKYTHSGGWAINLYKRRHEAGRTYGRSVDSAQLNALRTLDKAGDKAGVLHMLRTIVKGDAQEITNKVKATKSDVESAKWWEDVRKKAKGADRLKLATRIVNRIKEGEAKIEQQPLE